MNYIKEDCKNCVLRYRCDDNPDICRTNGQYKYNINRKKKIRNEIYESLIKRIR